MFFPVENLHIFPGNTENIFIELKVKDMAALPFLLVISVILGIMPPTIRIRDIARSFVIIFFEKGLPVLFISSNIRLRSPSSAKMMKQ